MSVAFKSILSIKYGRESPHGEDKSEEDGEQTNQEKEELKKLKKAKTQNNLETSYTLKDEEAGQIMPHPSI